MRMTESLCYHLKLHVTIPRIRCQRKLLLRNAIYILLTVCISLNVGFHTDIDLILVAGQMVICKNMAGACGR